MLRLVSVVLLFSLSTAACSLDPNAVKQDYVSKGDRYMEKRQYREAIIEYTNALKRDSRFGPVRFKLAEAYLAAGQKRAAFPEFIRAADLLPDNVEAQLRAGHLLLQGGLFEEARVRARTVLQKNPTNPIALVMLGNALAGLKSLDDAITVMQRAATVDPERAGIQANLGVLEMARGNLGVAEDAFKKAVTVSNGAPDAQLALANFYRATSRWPEAEAILRTVLGRVPSYVPANLAMAAVLVQTGRAAEAEQYFRLVANIQRDGPSRLALASFYVSAGRDSDALATLDLLAREPAHFAEARIQSSMLHFMRGRRGEATKIIDEVLTREPGNAKALTVKSRLNLMDNRVTDALNRINESLKIDRDSPDAYLTRGRINVVLRKDDAAGADFNEALRLDPESVAARLELSDLHRKRNEIDSAIQMAEHAVSGSHGSLPARLALIRALLVRADDRKRADSELKDVLTAYPRSPEVFAMLGASGLGKGDSASARRAFETALKLDPHSVEASTGLIALDLAENRAPAARERAEALVASKPGDLPSLMLAANVYGLSGDVAKAEAILKRAMEAEPSNPSVYSLLGGLYIRQNRTAEAIKEFTRVAELEPRSIGAATMLGLLYYADHKVQDAQMWWQKALAIEPRAAAAANNLAWVYAEKNENLEVALQLAQTARGAYPDEPSVLDTLGWVYYRKGMAVLGTQYIEQSIEKQPNNPVYHYHLGKAYAERGEDAKARRALERALALNPSFEGAKDARATLSKLVF